MTTPPTRPQPPPLPPDTSSLTRVHLLAGRPLFFPFPSGALTYSCVGCDAPCCKGQPIGIGRSRELVTIQQAQPRAPLFAVPGWNDGPLLSLTPPPEKCWFFDKNGRCRLEHVAGRDAKPTGCRLFPFSRIVTMGEALAVLPDLVCPVSVTPTAERALASTSSSHPSSYDTLALEMSRTQLPRGGHKALPAPADLSWDEALPLERHVVAAAADLLRAAPPPAFYGAFADLQHQLTSALLGVDTKPSAMASLESDIRRFLAVTEAASVDGVVELVALTGVLRLTPIDGAVVPRRAAPAMLVALAVLASVHESMRGSRRTPRTLLGLWRTQGPLLYALAHLGSRPLPLSPAALDAALARYHAPRRALVAVVDAIRDNGARSVAATVDELLRQQKDEFAPPLTADAVAMLHALGRILREACTFTPI
ncbi:MAG: YkgJ family cysteine cluster protein [Deltaproteobacteria bacterium]|nr:YkgJ family cysteine cluster protein [Deltaproteobacteria bacterium]